LLHKSQFAEVPIHSHWNRPDVRRSVPAHTVDAPLLVRVNDGRWIVQCEVCNGAQLASRNDHRFFCVDCCNVSHGGGWRPVAWPAEHEAIEATLSARPLPNTRHWLPGESVADLERENVVR